MRLNLPLRQQLARHLPKPRRILQILRLRRRNLIVLPILLPERRIRHRDLDLDILPWKAINVQQRAVLASPTPKSLSANCHARRQRNAVEHVRQRIPRRLADALPNPRLLVVEDLIRTELLHQLKVPRRARRQHRRAAAQLRKLYRQRPRRRAAAINQHREPLLPLLLPLPLPRHRGPRQPQTLIQPLRHRRNPRPHRRRLRHAHHPLRHPHRQRRARHDVLGKRAVLGVARVAAVSNTSNTITDGESGDVGADGLDDAAVVAAGQQARLAAQVDGLPVGGVEGDVRDGDGEVVGALAGEGPVGDEGGVGTGEDLDGALGFGGGGHVLLVVAFFLGKIDGLDWVDCGVVRSGRGQYLCGVALTGY